MILRWTVYTKRRMDGQTIEACHTDLSTSEVQALRFDAHLLPGTLLEFDAIETRTT